jgi:hypothetical protein
MRLVKNGRKNGEGRREEEKGNVQKREARSEKIPVNFRAKRRKEKMRWCWMTRPFIPR